jgi:Ni/Co efflux regulator RcnB
VSRGHHGGEWGGRHNDWAEHGAWSHGRDWWHGRHGWTNFRGFRDHFFFAPGWGYYAIPPEYWGTTWDVGDYLPEYFWRYQITDYADYGLSDPPEGCAWIWLNGNVALVDLGDGYIVDMAYDVWE